MPSPLSRRRFLQVGALGAAALATAGGWSAWRVRRLAADDRLPLPEPGRAFLLALAPAFLDGAAPANHWTDATRAEFAAQLATTLGTLPPPVRTELRQLFALMDIAPARLLLAGRWGDWQRATPDDARAVLARWRGARQPLLTSAYQGLHDIVLATWYATPAHWAALGYPGPPVLSAPTAPAAAPAGRA